MSKFSGDDPHGSQTVFTAGAAIENAEGFVVCVHGRGATAESILGLFEELDLSSFAAVAPQAAGNTWYPNSFLAPIESNQPFLDSALGRIESIVSDLISRGVASEKISLLGFSQGACLTCEFVARHPRRYRAVVAFTGGVIGPVGTAREYHGSLAGVSVFLGSSDPDHHVPFARVEETGEVFTRMGASVDVRRYPNMGHTINANEIAAAREIIRG